MDFHADRLRAFAAVARAGGFTRGARELGRSQSAVSQAVALLEAELGEALLVRDGRRVELTAAGRILLDRAERAFAELRQARAELAALRQLDVGRLVLGTSDTLATHRLPPAFAEFRRRHPAIELTLVNRPSPELARQVAARELDLAVVSLPLPRQLRIGGVAAEAVLRIEPLARQRDVVIAPCGHPLSTRSRISLAQLADEPLVLLDRSTATRALLDDRFAALGLAPHIAMEMSSVEVLKRLVELGFGLSVVPEVAATREVQQGTLAAIPLRGLGAERRIGLLTPTAGPLSRAAQVFIDVARAQLR